MKFGEDTEKDLAKIFYLTLCLRGDIFFIKKREPLARV
jgi:hypothetical protein